LTGKNIPSFKEKWYGYIDDEFKRREEGFWFINKGKPTYITGTHYMYLQWSKIDVGHRTFENRTDYSTYSGKLVKPIEEAMVCATLKIDGVDSHLCRQVKQSTLLQYRQTLDLVYYLNQVQMPKNVH
jgi:hypothetical protein